MTSYERPKPGRGGWTNWIQPVPKGYRMACCDCGLVHEINFTVVRAKRRRGRKLVVLFKARRHERATAATRRERQKARKGKR